MEKQRPPERGSDDGLLAHGKFTLGMYCWSSGKTSRCFVTRLTGLGVGEKESWTVGETNDVVDVRQCAQVGFQGRAAKAGVAGTCGLDCDDVVVG